MNKAIITVLAAATIAAGNSCRKTAMTDFENPERKIDISVNISSGSQAVQSKATISEENEKAIQNVQVLVFRTDGCLDAYTSSDTGSEIRVNCTAGKRHIYALVNAKNVSGIAKLDEFMALRSGLEDNSLENFVMFGSLSDVSLESGSSIGLEVERLAARVSIHNISVRFSSEAYRSSEFKIKSIYMINVAGDIDLGRKTVPQTWHNPEKYIPGNADELLYENITDGIVAEEKPYDKVSGFYVYPNAGRTDFAGVKVTRLVVETELDGKIYYYPISIPDIESNRKYEITRLTITRPGSTNPDIPVTSLECSFNISITDWKTGTVEEWTI